jgi:hypothetical protein
MTERHALELIGYGCLGSSRHRALATVGIDGAIARVIADRRMGNTSRGEFEFVGRDGSRLSIVKEEAAVGVSSPGIISALKGSVLRALAQPGGGLEFV